MGKRKLVVVGRVLDIESKELGDKLLGLKVIDTQNFQREFILGRENIKNMFEYSDVLNFCLTNNKLESVLADVSVTDYAIYDKCLRLRRLGNYCESYFVGYSMEEPVNEVVIRVVNSLFEDANCDMRSLDDNEKRSVAALFADEAYHNHSFSFNIAEYTGFDAFEINDAKDCLFLLKPLDAEIKTYTTLCDLRDKIDCYDYDIAFSWYKLINGCDEMEDLDLLAETIEDLKDKNYEEADGEADEEADGDELDVYTASLDIMMSKIDCTGKFISATVSFEGTESKFHIKVNWKNRFVVDTDIDELHKRLINKLVKALCYQAIMSGEHCVRRMMLNWH